MKESFDLVVLRLNLQLCVLILESCKLFSPVAEEFSAVCHGRSVEGREQDSERKGERKKKLYIFPVACCSIWGQMSIIY
jgi:hypothetical protein